MTELKLKALEAQFKQECREIAAQCAEEGYPSTGSNYELRVEELRKWYPELFQLEEEEEW